MRWHLLLRPNGAPAVLDDRWLLRLTADRRQTGSRHELEVGLNPSTPPSVTVDFLWIVWRIQVPSAALRVQTHAAALAAEAVGAADEPPLTSCSFAHPDAPWRTRRGGLRYGVTFQLDVMPVYRPKLHD